MTIRPYRAKLIAAVIVILLSFGTITKTQTPYTYTVIANLGPSVTAWAPSLNNSGQTAFVTTGGQVLRGDGTSLTTIYSYGPEQPGPSGHSPINAAGMVVFTAGGIPFSPRIVAGDGTTPATVIATGGPTWEDVRNPSINDAGQVVYEARLHGTVTSYILMGSAFAPVASPGDTVPGGTLTSAYGPKINNIADVAFTASVDGGPGSIFRKRADDLMFMGPASGLGELTFGMNDAGVVASWRGAGRIVASDGVTETVIAEQSAGFIPQPHRVAINDAGQVAFVAGDGTGVPAGNRVLVGDGADLHQVLHAGDSIPGLGTVLDVSISNDAINDVGQVAILVTFDDGTGVAQYAVVRANPPTNTPPVASTGSGTVTAGETSSGTLSASDVDGDALTYALVSNGTKGTATITNTATGAYTYAAAGGSTGTDTFSFKVNDGSADSNVATVTMTIVAAPACAADVTALVDVVGSAIRVDRKTGNLIQKVTLKNVGSSALTGPIALVLDSLPSGISLIGAIGTTGCAAPRGSPYVMVNMGSDSVLTVRERATVELRFIQTGSTALSYTTRVLAGAGNR